MSKYLFCLALSLVVSPVFASGNLVVGCWEAEIEKFNNQVTICINHKVGSITTYFSNEGTDSDPTRCYQPGFVEYEPNGNAILEGLGGYCENEREQAELTLKCEPSMSDSMRCELYTDLHEVTAKKVKRIE